jgi:hypothetical protein
MPRLWCDLERFTSKPTSGSRNPAEEYQLVQQAPVHDTRMENYAAKIAESAVLPALILAGVVLAMTPTQLGRLPFSPLTL